MSDYAYPFDPTGTNPECLVVEEQHKLEDYSNPWGCIIPLFAPFYRKDLTLRHVEQDRILYEGIDYYLGHYYQTASEEYKMAIFGSVMIIDKTLSGTIEFVKYRTVGDRFNVPKRVIDTHLNQVDMRDPRNLDWEDVMRNSVAIPAISVPENITEAIAEDLPTGALDRIQQALERLNVAQKNGYDSVMDALAALADKIHAHDIDNHAHKRGRHQITAEQLNALHRDEVAVDALKAYGYTLAELATVINLMGVNAEDTDTLFKLIGDTLEGRLEFVGDNLIIQNSNGAAVINIKNDDMSILSTSDVLLEADADMEIDDVTASLRAGNNLLTVHSTYSELYADAVVHNSTANLPHPEAKCVAPNSTWSVSSGRFILHKQVYFPGGDATIGVTSDNSYKLFIDGVLLKTETAWPAPAYNTFNVSEGFHWVTFICINGGGPGLLAASFHDGPLVFDYTDTSWQCRDITGENENDWITRYPNGSDDSAVFNGFYLIHVGNVQDFFPPPEYEDTILYSQATPTMYLTGRGVESSPLTGYVFYPIATSTSEGVFKLSHSLYSVNDTTAASGRALYNLQQLANAKVDNTFTINGHRLNADITITAAQLGLGNVNNTAPEDKIASDAFLAEVATKSDANHTHNENDFTGTPLANQETFGLTKITTTLDNREDIAITPSALNAPYQKHLLAESTLDDKMPAMPFNIMQYGGYGYLPKPVLGNYARAGIGSRSVVGCIESDGRLVCLRAGSDFTGRGVYYWYGTFSSDGKFDKVVATSTEYRPKFIDSDDWVVEVYRGGEGVFALKTNKGKYYIVLTRNTMDMSKHAGSEIVELNGLSLGNRAHMYLYKDKVHIHYHYFGNGGVYNRHWTVNLSDIDAGNVVSLQRVLLSGTDWSGNRLTDQEVFRFSDIGVSTSISSTTPIIHLLDNGFWSGSKNALHANQNTMSAIKDNLVRFQVCARTYFSNAFDAKITPYIHTCLLNLDTMELISENADDFPIRLYEDRFEYPNRRIFNETWPGAFPNWDTPTFISKGRMFSVKFWPGIYQTVLHEFKSADEQDPFDYLKPYSATPQIVTDTIYEGGVGSVVKEAHKNLGFLEGNKLFTTHIDNTVAISEYDINGSYLNNGKGWGATSNRYSLSVNDYRALIRVPMNWNTGKNEGFVLSSNVLVSNSAIVNEVATKPVSWSTGLINDLKSRLLAKEPPVGSYIVDETALMLHSFGDWESGDLTSFIQYTRTEWYDATKTRKRVLTYTYRCEITMSGGSVSAVDVGVILKVIAWSTAVHNLGTFESFGMNMCGTTDDGHHIYMLNHSQFASSVGFAGGCNLITVLDKDTGIQRFQEANGITKYTMNCNIWHPDLGYARLKQDSTLQATVAELRGRTLDEIKAVAILDEVIIHGTPVASGWVVYFTEEERFYVQGQSVTLPVQDFDLSRMSEFPSYQNKTFYVYAVAEFGEDGGIIPSYRFQLTKTEDTQTELYIGFVKTGNTSIEEINIERATRLGELYELEEHKYDPKAHNDITNLDKESFGLSSVKNMKMIHTLELPTFKDVFDTWRRFVHEIRFNTQPSKESLLDSWTYNSSLEAIQSKSDAFTQHHLVGFVSPESIGDYTFDTNIYAHSDADGDDDWAGVVLAFNEDGDGKEHTLIAMVSGGASYQELYKHINGDLTTYSVAVVYNFHQNNARVLHADLPLDPVRVMKTRGRTRIKAVRKNDTIEVLFYGWENDGNYGDIISKAVIDLNDTDLRVFKGDAHFGYMSQSQGFSTFENISRPDGAVGNYYASADAVRLLSENQAESVTFAEGTVVAGGEIPIPAGFTSSQCQVVLTHYKDTTSLRRLLYYRAEYINSRGRLYCRITTRRETVPGLIINPSLAIAKYFLVARK